MRRLIKSLLMVIATSVFTGTASAYWISAVKTSSTGYGPSDTLVVDILLDTQGERLYEFSLYVDFDPAILWPDQDNTVRHPLPGEDFGSLYLYPESWNIMSSAYIGPPMEAYDGSIATLVFHVIDMPISTLVVPNFDYGPFGRFVGEGEVGAMDMTDVVPLYSLHIPEPTTTALMGLGLLGILWAGRRW